jgi:hypothetical protein
VAVFNASLVARVPALSGPPLLVEVDRLVFDQLSYTDELNRPGTGTLGCPIRSLSGAVRDRLQDLSRFPSEVWVYRDSTIAWAGEIQTLSVQDQVVNLSCAGLLGYTSRMGVTSDLVFDNIDQFDIATGLVDHWQNLPYGHYGIDTMSAGLSGVERHRTYLRDELHNIGTRLLELGAVINGFDIHVNAASRALVLSFPARGIDLTDTVFFDKRNIDSAAVALSVAPDDLVTDLSATGTRENDAGTNTITYAARTNAALRASYGRSWAGQNFSNVTVAETVEGHADAYLAVRDGVMFQPGVTIMPRLGADVGDFGPGDVVAYSYDAGLGLQSGEYRISKVTVTVKSDGEQRIGVEFV